MEPTLQVLNDLERDGVDRPTLDKAYYRAREEAERVLRDEIGDPTPVRLA